MINRKIEAILFDFDGTLADTSEDMVNCLNILLQNNSIKNVELLDAKKFISQGAGGLIDFACPKISDDVRKRYINEYLEIYKKNIFTKTHLFDGIMDIIDCLIAKNYKWGIVTNKPSYLVNPIVDMLNFNYKPSCIVAGDTLTVKKPSPEPLLYAAKLIQCEPIFCAYVGDDIRDIIAANEAGMFSIAAAYGFIEDPKKIEEWGYDYKIGTPSDLKNLII